MENHFQFERFERKTDSGQQKKCTEILDFMFNVYKRNICLMFLWKWNITFMCRIYGLYIQWYQNDFSSFLIKKKLPYQ